nr:MAG TPA: hypothetical protein [Caudoviricetes sp.]
MPRRKYKPRALPPADPAKNCYECFCPFRHNCTESAWSCANAWMCASRRRERSGQPCQG